MGWGAGEGEGERALLFLLISTLILSDQSAIAMTSFNLNYFPNIATLGVELQHRNLAATHTFST